MTSNGSPESALNIGEFAGQSGVNVDSVHYCERRGLLPVTARSAAGYRKISPWLADQMDRNVWGIAIGVVAAIGMPLLAKAKLKVASPQRLNSSALRADAMEAFTCGYLSWMMIAGLAVTRLLNWWWLDSVATLALLLFLLRKGSEAINGKCGCGSENNCN